MDHKNSEKSLRWLANQFPVVEHPKDNTVQAQRHLLEMDMH